MWVLIARIPDREVSRYFASEEKINKKALLLHIARASCIE